MIVDLQDLNKITKSDLYFMSLQMNMLQVRQKAVTQKEMKISQNLQKFQADHIIRFVLKNVQIYVDSRKD